MPNPNLMALDRQSARSVDADGRLHVSRTNISKAAVNPYYGREIPGWQQLGLDGDKVYHLYRDPEELAKGAGTFNNLPILNKHLPVTVDSPQKDNVVGSIGSDVTFSEPYLQASMCIWDSSAIAGVESEKQCELSCGYRYDPDMTPGATSGGEAYDGVMRNIRGNHLALVEVGRAGPDVVVADNQTVFKQPKETPVMKMSKLGKALFVSLRGLSPKIAQDAAFAALVGDAEKGSFKKATVLKGMLAMDSDIDPEKADEIIDAVVGVEESPEAVELDREIGQDEPDLMSFLDGKLSPEDLESVKGMLPAAKDESPAMKPEDVNATVEAAMDSMRACFKQLEQAKADVRSVVGNVIGMDSAEQVYRFALDHMGVAHKEMPAQGLNAVFSALKDRRAPVSRDPKIAADSAATVDKFNLGRFGRA